MTKGKCIKCGKEWYGYALLLEEHQVCDCGGKIIITKEVNTCK